MKASRYAQIAAGRGGTGSHVDRVSIYIYIHIYTYMKIDLMWKRRDRCSKRLCGHMWPSQHKYIYIHIYTYIYIYIHIWKCVSCERGESDATHRPLLEEVVQGVMSHIWTGHVSRQRVMSHGAHRSLFEEVVQGVVSHMNRSRALCLCGSLL